MQAGSSNEGRAFAARNAEAIFTAHQTLADAQAFYADIKSRRAASAATPTREDPARHQPVPRRHRGRGPGAVPLLQRAHVPAYGLVQLERIAGFSLRHLELDEPVPAEFFGGAGDVLDNQRSRLQVVANIVERDSPTLRELLHRLAGGRGHNVVAGTPVQVADTIEEWFEGGAADGFNVMPPLYPQLLEVFAEKVVPILQDRGLFRTEYSGATLRDHYGLPRPESQYAQQQPVAAGQL